ncbi:GNAT family N-acetyltransferase [Celeribacter arenosi]|uniref:N-acetyltransferase n=1 Tax=Celeribacter arenosi TaxID=792649 RepID=A0ABP7K2C2_9RHOB
MSSPDFEALARVHAQTFDTPPPWSARDFAEMLASERVFLVAPAPMAFALGRVVVDEAELLTLAVAPDAQGRGFGRAAFLAYESEAMARGATRSFLDVAQTNTRALALYRSAGYDESGRRRAYYRTRDGSGVDAIIMTKLLKQA